MCEGEATLPVLVVESGIVSTTPSSQSIVRIVVATPVITFSVIGVPDLTVKEVGVTVNPGSNVVVEVAVVAAAVDVVVVVVAVVVFVP